MTRVAFFSNQFADAQGHGLARYARELFGALRDDERLDVTPVAAWSSMDRDALAAYKAQTGLHILPLGRRLPPLAWTYLDAPPIERLMTGEVDVVHAVALGYPVSTRRPFVVTVHDLGPLTHPEYFTNTRPWVMERSLRQAERQADVIICVSSSTADEVEGYLGSHVANRIRVVHEGVSAEFFERVEPACLDGLSLPEARTPVILSAGKISPRKNVQGVMEALSRLVDEIPHHLVLVGGAGWDTREVLRGLDNPRLSARVHLLDYVSDEQLRALYQRADLYVHPSFYEGFGLTVLEAMASGTPVITANSSSLPEVAGDAAVLVDPSDTGALAEAILGIARDDAAAARLTEKGLARARSFDWANTRDEVSAIYRQLDRSGERRCA